MSTFYTHWTLFLIHGWQMDERRSRLGATYVRSAMLYSAPWSRTPLRQRVHIGHAQKPQCRVAFYAWSANSKRCNRYEGIRVCISRLHSGSPVQCTRGCGVGSFSMNWPRHAMWTRMMGNAIRTFFFLMRCRYLCICVGGVAYGTENNSCGLGVGSA